MDELTREGLVEAARNAAAGSGGALSRADFVRATGISQYHIYRLFPEGGWSAVLAQAGIERHSKHNLPLGDDEILAEYHKVASDLMRLPTWSQFSAAAAISDVVVRRRFGGLQGTRRAYRDWLDKNHPDSPLVQELGTQSKHELPPPPLPSSQDPAQARDADEWPKQQGPLYGAPISFRGLRHAPVNEQGVVYLFGMVSYELGFLVEAVHAAFPDCEAKRCVDQKRNRWQRVRIEFEYQSRNFLAHGHDSSGCDLVVCWEHNWPECQLEVLELRRVLDELEA